MQSHDFLNLYKTLEDELEARYNRAGRRYSSVVMEFINSPEGKPWREKMDMCREIRNLMTHTADIDGQPVVTPARGVVEILREILNYVQSPPLALDYATRAANILRTNSGEKVLPLMRGMAKRGFSHVPVLEGERIAGVFSVSTVFSGALMGYPAIDEETRVRDYAELLPFDEHSSEQFAFVDEETTLSEARAAFECGKERKKRMAALFITRGGHPDGKLIGMLTPWDVLRAE